MNADAVLFESCHINKKNKIKHIVWQRKYHGKGFKNDKYLHLYSLGKGTMGNGTSQNVSWEKGHLILWETDIPPSGNDFILWESDHLSSGSRDILWETRHGKRKHAILWDSDHLSSGKHPLGIGNLGDEVQP